jgi:hypothetical protein
MFVSGAGTHISGVVTDPRGFANSVIFHCKAELLTRLAADSCYLDVSYRSTIREFRYKSLNHVFPPNRDSSVSLIWR